MINKFSIYISMFAVLLLPNFVFAQGSRCPSGGPTLCSLIETILRYTNQVLFLMMGVAVAMFVFYIIKYFIKADADRSQGGQYVMFSLIGFFVILSMWGLVNILQNTFGLQNERNRPRAWESFTQLFPGGSSPAPRYTNSDGPLINQSFQPTNSDGLEIDYSYRSTNSDGPVGSQSSVTPNSGGSAVFGENRTNTSPRGPVE